MVDRGPLDGHAVGHAGSVLAGMAMLKIQDISYEVDGRQILSHLSVQVHPGAIVAICGRNGSGKSTLLRSACGLVRAQAGTVSCDGFDMELTGFERGDIRSLFQRLGYMQQDPVNQLVSTLVYDEVAFGPQNLGLPATAVRSRVRDALALVGLSARIDDEVAALSGGEQQRLALAAVLAMRPRYLLLDEPTSMLDTGLRSSFRSLIEELSHTKGIGVALVTHEPLEVLCADSVIVIDGGECVWEGSPASLCREEPDLWSRTVRQTPTALVAQAALVDWDGGASHPGARLSEEDLAAWCRHHPERAASVAGRFPCDHSRHKGAGISGERKLDGKARVSGSDAAEPVVIVKNVSFSYGAVAPVEAKRTGRAGSFGGGEGSRGDSAHGSSGAARALSSVSFSLHRGETMLLAGVSGSGKSTLAAIAAGLYAPDAGTVLVAGEPPQAGSIAYAFQRPEGQFFLDTVEDEIAYALRNRGIDEGEVRARVRERARETGIANELLPRYPFHLSGGQQRRVGIAAALAVSSPLVILDEPTAGMDVPGRSSLHALVARLANRGHAVLVISHDIEEWAMQCDTALLLSQGVAAWTGPAGELLADSEPSRRAAMEPPLVARLRKEGASNGGSSRQHGGVRVHAVREGGLRAPVGAEAGREAPEGGRQVPVSVDSGVEARVVARRARGIASGLVGSYTGPQTVAAKRDARVKIALLLAATVTLFAAYAPLTLVVGAIMLPACMRAARVDGRAVARALRPVGVILVMTVCANMIRIGGVGPGESGLSLGTLFGMPVGLSFTGAERGMLAVLRIVMLLGYSIVVSASTTAHELADGCARLLRPLERLGVPVGAISTVLSLALRFMPLVGEEVERIRLVQRARGASFDRGSLFHRVSVWASVFTPLVVGLFRRAECIADAMTTRCYDAERGSVVEPRALEPLDIGLLAGGLLLMAALFAAAQGHVIG